MLTEKFTLLELADLALRVPEIGAVNFNILHTVLITLISNAGLGGLKTACHIEDETLAQAAITRGRLEGEKRRPSKVQTVQEIKDSMRTLDEGLSSATTRTMDQKKAEDISGISQETPTNEDDPETTDYVAGTSQQSRTEDKKETIETVANEEGIAQKSVADDVVKEVVAEEDKVTDDVAKEVVAEDDKIADDVPKDKIDEKKGDEDIIDEEKESAEKGGEEIEVLREVLESKLEEVQLRQDTEPSVSNEEPPDSQSIAELQESAREILDQSGDLLAERAVAVTEALKILEDEELLDSDPAKVIEEMWRSTNINRRMEGAESGLRELSSIVDVMLDKLQEIEERGDEVLNQTKDMFEKISSFLEKIKILEEACKTLAVRVEDANEQRVLEVERLESILKDLKKDSEETKSTLESLEANHDDLAERVAYKDELEVLKEDLSEVIEAKIKEMKKLLYEVEDTLVKKEDYMEMVSRMETVEENKVNREELERLLEPGFIDSFLEEQANLRAELEELKETVAELETNLEALKTRIDEEIIKTMEANFAEINASLEVINAKLALLDPDEINDSFANLEEQAEMIIQELEAMKLAAEAFQKEAKINFNKISNFNDLINRLEKTKADKSKMYELLEGKADLDMIMSKLDRSEFVAVVGDMKDSLERLTITVKINEEETNEGFLKVRHELALKMYTEDFIIATEPIRNRIKATIYELERVKQIALTHLFPDAPGVAKCFSCNRGAHLAGPKYAGDAQVEFLQEIRLRANTLSTSSKSPAPELSHQEASSVKLPPIDDLDRVPIPPPDHPREQEVGRLPVLFASARPQVGLAHEMRQSTIDKKLAAYFATRPVRPCEGEYTRTSPQQRGLSFAAVQIPLTEKEEVLLEGIDGGIYKGSVNEGVILDDAPEKRTPETRTAAFDKEKTEIKSLKEPRWKKGFIKPIIKPRHKKSTDPVPPSVVSLHVDDEPLQKTSSRTKASQDVLLLPTWNTSVHKKF